MALDAAVSETPVVNTNLVALAVALNALSAIAWIPAATVAPSVPSESPAANSIDAMTSLVISTFSSDLSCSTQGLLSPDVLFVIVRPTSATCVKVTSGLTQSAPKLIDLPSVGSAKLPVLSKTNFCVAADE